MGLNSKIYGIKDDVNDETALLSSQSQHFDQSEYFESTKLPLSVDEVIETLQVGAFHYIFLLICGLCLSLYIMSYTALSLILITACDLNIHPTSKGWLSLCFMFGVGFGSPIIGKLSDSYGRWKAMMISVTIQLSCITAAAFSYNYTMLLVMFFMIGIAGGGIFTVAPSYTVEFFPQSYRGFTSGGQLISTIVANIYVCLMALVILPVRFNIHLGTIHLTSWRIFLLVCFMPATVVYILLFFMPESLRFVLINGKIQDSIQTLDRMKQINSYCKICDNSSQQEIRSLLLNDWDEIINEESRGQDTGDINESDAKLHKKPWIIRLFIMGLVWITSGFGVDGLIVWIPTIVDFYQNGHQCRYHAHRNSSWPSMHTLQSPNASFCAGNKDITPVTLTILYGSIATLPCALFLLFAINRIGRKWLFCLLIFLNGMSVLLMLLVDNILAASVMAIFCNAFSNTVMIPLTTWSAELFPTTIRSTSLGILHVLFALIPGVGMWIIGVTFAYSCMITLILFISLNLLAGLISLYLPDTTNADIK